MTKTKIKNPYKKDQRSKGADKDKSSAIISPVSSPKRSYYKVGRKNNFVSSYSPPARREKILTERVGVDGSFLLVKCVQESNGNGGYLYPVHKPLTKYDADPNDVPKSYGALKWDMRYKNYCYE